MSVGQVYAIGHVCSEVSISIGVAYSYKGENHLDDEYHTHYDGNRPVGLYLWIQCLKPVNHQCLCHLLLALISS